MLLHGGKLRNQLPLSELGTELSSPEWSGRQQLILSHSQAHQPQRRLEPSGRKHPRTPSRKLYRPLCPSSRRLNQLKCEELRGP